MMWKKKSESPTNRIFLVAKIIFFYLIIVYNYVFEV